MKVKVSLEFAEDRGLVPKVDGYNYDSFFGIPVVKECSEDAYRMRYERRNQRTGVDENGMVEVDLQAIKDSL